jgi:hypothetical protein
MARNIGHVPALFEQIINIAIYGIIDNLGHPILAQAHLVADFLLGAAQAGKSDDDGFAAGRLPGTDILIQVFTAWRLTPAFRSQASLTCDLGLLSLLGDNQFRNRGFLLLKGAYSTLSI